MFLKTLLEQLNANAKRQTLANIIDESGMNKIIHDYDNYVAVPEGSEIKETLKQNLLSRIAKQKSLNCCCLSKNRIHNISELEEVSQVSSMQLKLGIRSVKDFKEQISQIGFKKSADGKLIDNNGEKTNTNYYKVLNDFGRNISNKGSFLLNDDEKN